MIFIIRTILFVVISVVLNIGITVLLASNELSMLVSTALATSISGLIIILIIYLKDKSLIHFSKIKWLILLKYIYFLLGFRFLHFTIYKFCLDKEVSFLSLYNKTIDLAYAFDVFVTIIIVPFTEEIIFRGVPSEYLLKNKTNKALIICVTSILFGLAHMPGVFYFTFFSIFGALLSLVYLKERNIWYCIILHFLYNLSSVLIF